MRRDLMSIFGSIAGFMMGSLIINTTISQYTSFYYIPGLFLTVLWAYKPNYVGV